MKLLFDQNLAHRLVVALDRQYPGSQHLNQLGMERASDEAVWIYAQDHGMTIVSKDSDFYHLSMLLGHPPKVVHIRLGNCTTAEISELLSARHADLLAFDQDTSASCFVLPFQI